jgi:hypothetical protein
MNSVTVNVTHPVIAPRGANLAAKWFGALWRALQPSAPHQPEDRERSGRHAEAARVRTFAQGLMSHDPRFAADLFAAADRHERQGSR